MFARTLKGALVASTMFVGAAQAQGYGGGYGGQGYGSGGGHGRKDLLGQSMHSRAAAMAKSPQECDGPLCKAPAHQNGQNGCKTNHGRHPCAGRR